MQICNIYIYINQNLYKIYGSSMTSIRLAVFFLFLATGLERVDCATCTQGQYLTQSNQCTPCPAGTYCALSTGCISNCTQCPLNSGSMAGASTCLGPFCQSCPPGFYCEGGTSIKVSMPVTFSNNQFCSKKKTERLQANLV